jgi:hypothetical protein
MLGLPPGFCWGQDAKKRHKRLEQQGLNRPVAVIHTAFNENLRAHGLHGPGCHPVDELLSSQTCTLLALWGNRHQETSLIPQDRRQHA